MKFWNGAAVSTRLGRTPHGVRGLKYALKGYAEDLRGGRTPHGVRGLK